MAVPDIVPLLESPDWDEAQCKAALARLERLQDQLDELRLTIPSIVEPLRIRHETPEQLFKALNRAASDGTRALAGFRTAWHDQTTQVIFECTKQSQRANSDLGAGANLPRYGWSEIDAQKSAEDRIDGPNDTLNYHAEINRTGSEQTVEEAVKRFKATHPNFTVDHDAQNETIKVRFKVTTLLMNFIISYKKDSEENHKLDVECTGTSRIFGAIARCIASRPQPNNLQYLLDMIASYKNTRSTSCVTCGRLLDRTALTPAARRSKQVRNAEGGVDTVWEAYHESCLYASNPDHP